MAKAGMTVKETKELVGTLDIKNQGVMMNGLLVKIFDSLADFDGNDIKIIASNTTENLESDEGLQPNELGEE